MGTPLVRGTLVRRVGGKPAGPGRVGQHMISVRCRRQKGLNVAIAYRQSTGALHLLIDSTGTKAESEGEWFATKHGPSKPRQWRKAHLGIDADTLEIRAIRPGTKPSAPPAALAARSGDAGTGITDEIWSGQRYDAASSSGNALWHATSTGRSPSYRSGRRS